MRENSYRNARVYWKGGVILSSYRRTWASLYQGKQGSLQRTRTSAAMEQSQAPTGDLLQTEMPGMTEDLHRVWGRSKKT